MPIKTLRPPPVWNPTATYVLPFAVFTGFMAIQRYAPLPPTLDLVLRAVVLTGVLAIGSRRVLDFPPTRPFSSILLGAIVFGIWIAPDLLFPGYRHHWIFENGWLGTLDTAFPIDLRHDRGALWLRSYRAVILVPVIEELFWRGWLMRWLIHPRFERVAPGAFGVASFTITAILFGSEHGPYWDVGLAAGVLYNLWMVKTKCLFDCMLAHAVTNLCLCIYVIATSQWQYWL